MQEYVLMNLRDIEKLEREKTIFFDGRQSDRGSRAASAARHGCLCRRRSAEKICGGAEKEFPDFTLVKMPPPCT